MAIIYTYPVKAVPNANDLILISDSEDSNKTKQVKISTLPGGSGSGVSSLTSANAAITVANPTTTPVLTSVAYTGGASIGHVPTGSGSSATVYLDGTGSWSTPAGSGGISSITGTSPVSVTSGSTPVVSMAQASASASGYLTTTDWTTFNNKSDGTPGGSSTQFQYNNGTTFAGTDSLRFDADKIHMGRSTSPITRGQLVMYGDGTNASDIQLYNGANNRFLKIAQQAGATQDLTLTFPGVAPGGSNKILESDASGQLSWIDTPSGSGISFSGTTANGIATYSNSTTANVSSAFTISGNKLSAPVGSLADPSIEVGAIGGLYAASGGILLAHNGANAIGVTSSSIVNYKLTQFQAGLKFGATGETLSSYEEGTWTPVMFQSSSPSVTATGYYIKIGKKVTAFFTLVCTAGGSAEISNARISGLPFNAYSGNGYKAGVSIAQNTANASNQKYIAGEPGGATTLDLKVFTSGTDYQYAQGRWPNSQGNFTVSGSYTYHAQS